MADPTGPTGPELERAHRERLSALSGELRGARSSLRRVGYSDAEALCDRLAAKLLDELGRQGVQESRWVAVPRGGLIVLGLLSYFLDLGAEQLASPEPGDRVVVVDDCGLTGKRLHDFLAGLKASEVTVALLFASPGLLAEIPRIDGRIGAALAAEELVGLDPVGESGTTPWSERLGPGRVAYAPVEPVAFAWSEPDHLFWNAATERAESGWRMLPPHRCIKNRARLGPPPARPPIARWRVPAAVVHGQFEGSTEEGPTVWLCHSETEAVFSLDGPAAELWRRLARHGDLELAAEELAASFEVEPDRLRRDLEGLVAELASRGLVEEVPSAD